MTTEMSFATPPSTLSPNPLFSHPTKSTHQRTRSQTHIVIPDIKHTATRLQCLSNYKLRLESSQNEPHLRHLLGHISIYDNVRDYKKEQMTKAAFVSEPSPAPERPQQQPAKQLDPSNELQEYLSLQRVRVPSFQDFQAAIEMQLATLTEIQSASKRLQALANSCPTIDEGDEMEVGVEEYHEGDSHSDTVSDYDSYDGEGGWRDEEDGAESEGSMTDPESVRSEPSSPVEEKSEDDLFAIRPLAPLVCVGIGANF
jgi:hypothetical protein